MNTYNYTDNSAVSSAVGQVMTEDPRLAQRALRAAVLVECPERIPLHDPRLDSRSWAVPLPSGGVAVIQIHLLEALADLTLSIQVVPERKEAAQELYQEITDRAEAILGPERRPTEVPSTTTEEATDDLPF